MLNVTEGWHRPQRVRIQPFRDSLGLCALAFNSLLANRPVASEFLRAAVTPQFNVSFSLVSRVSKHLIEFIAIES